MKRWVAIGVTFWAPACQTDEPSMPEPEPLPVELAAPYEWIHVADPDLDVFGEGRPDDATCDAAGYRPENFGPDPVFEVKTGLCSWFTGAQPSMVDLEPGDTVGIRLFHYELAAAMPSQGRAALAIGGVVVWETTRPIPSPAALIEDEIVVEQSFPAQTELQFHVDNHGFNDWELFAIMATATGERD